MQIFRLTLLSCVSLFLSSAFAADSQYPKAPMNERVVAALVVGGSLPESIAADIRDYGVSFHPDEGYLSRLKKGGAAPTVLDALRHAKTFKSVSAGPLPADSTVLDHIFAAGEKLQDKKTFDAAKEIAATGGNLDDYPELAFVMGEVMRVQGGRAQSAQIYAKLADDAPGFPEVHTKFSYALYNVDDYESGLRESIAALARTPFNAEAHKNKGLNLEGMGNFDAAIAEDEQALALKPDYEKVRYNLGLLYYDRKDYINSIAEYRKALVLDPGDGNAHYNLALSLEMVHEYGSAIDECRKLIELDPRRTDVRMKLADLLVESGQKEAGIAEFRQLISLLPDSSYCHRCFARLLYRAHQLDEAEKEYRVAIQLDPTDAFSHAGLGLVLKRKKQPDEALKEFLQAGKLGFDTGVFHSEVGEIYLDQKQTSDAIRELKQAVSETPEDARAHSLLAQALEADNKSNEAIGEYRQAAALLGLSSVAGAAVERDLAAVLEKSGRSAEALQTYKQRYEAFPNEDTKSDYSAAKQRLAGSAVQNSPAIAKSAPAKSIQAPVVSDTATRADNQAAQVQALFDEKSRAMQAAIVQSALE